MRKSANRLALSTFAITAIFIAFGLSWPIRAESSFQNMEQDMRPTKDPITGDENLGNLTMPQQALAQFYKAFNSRDLTMIDQNFDGSDEVTIDNPLGGIRRGADQPHMMYEKIFKSEADLHVEFWDYTITELDNVFWAVGRERGTYQTPNGRVSIGIRTTRVFRKVGGVWRQVHHHGSIDDADALKAFQARFR